MSGSDSGEWSDETLPVDDPGDTVGVTLSSEHAPRPPRSSLARRSAFARGDQISRYVIVDELGAGGMGVVWAAYDPDLDRKVALKVLLPNTGGALSSEGRSRLLREAQALARLDHPNVVAVHDVGTHDAQIWIAMEFIDGQTLGAWFEGGAGGKRADTADTAGKPAGTAGKTAGKTGAKQRSGQTPRPWREVLDVMVQAGRGLEAAHAKGLVHRDFKPANVMLDREGRVRVMDFGLVHADAEPQTDEREHPEQPGALAADLTRAGALMGTPTHMAPEQHQGRSTDARTDQFAFCVTAWEGLYGERPFAGETLAQLAYSVTEGRLRRPPPGADVPPWLRAVLTRGLAVDPVERWPSMRAMLDEINEERTRKRSVAWRWLVSLGALGLAVSGAWTWQRVDRARTVETCERAGRALDELWTDEARASASASFAHTELPFAPETWARSSAALDDWVARWGRLRTQLCLEAERTQTWPAPKREAARDCFAMGEAEFTTLLGIYTDPEVSAAFVPTAVSLAMRLSDPQRCLDERRLAHQLTPEGDETHARVLELRARTMQASILAKAGRHDQALALAEAAHAEAETLDWRPIQAETLETLANTKHFVGDMDAALELHERAFFLASEIGHDEVAARASASIVGLLARSADYELALHWGRLSETFLVRVGLDGSVEAGTLLTNVGNVHMDLEHHEQALASFSRTIEIWETALGPEHPDLGIGLTNLGVELRKLDRDDEAFAAYQRAQAIFERSYGENHPIVGMALVNIGTIHSGRGEYREALAIQRQAEAALAGAFGPDDPRVTSPMNNQAVALYRLGHPLEALEIHRRVLAIREAADPEHPRVANSLSNIASLLYETGEYQGALDHAERALAIRLEVFGQRHSKVASSKYIEGMALRSLGRLDEAQAALELALKLRDELLGPEHQRTGLTLYELAQVELERGLPHAARRHLERAQPLVEDTPQQSGVRFELARLDYDAGQHAPALAEILALEEELQALGDSEDPDGAKRRRLPDIESWLAALPAVER